MKLLPMRGKDNKRRNLKSNILCVRGLKGLFLKLFGILTYVLVVIEGSAKTHLQHILTAAAINLERIYAWLEGIPLAQTRQSPA